MELFLEFQFIQDSLTMMIKTCVKQGLLFYSSLMIIWITVICYLLTTIVLQFCCRSYLLTEKSQLTGTLYSDRKGNSHVVAN